MIKIANIDRISSYLLNDLRKFNEIFRKDVFWDNIKSHKKPGFHPYLEDTSFEEPQVGSNYTQGILGLMNLPRSI